jgi:MEMO1 family protein
MASSDSIIRPPAVAGRFYPASPADLDRQVRAYLAAGMSDAPAVRACAAMAPHAGYVYSGGVAGKVFAHIHVPERVVLLCPNHTGLGKRIAVVDRGGFGIPGADIPIDAELAGAIIDEMPGASADRAAHVREHAIEVELPFLLARQPGLRIVPIALSGLLEREAVELGSAILRAVRRVGADPGTGVLVVASSDMSHYLPDSEARRVDRIALEPLLDFDPSGLYRTVVANDISMCGFIAATAMLSYARELGARPPRLVGYATSGEAFGDTSQVVGYAGVVVAM